MIDLALSVAKVAGMLALLAASLACASLVARRTHLDPELRRKLVHLGMGLCCVGLPLVFEHAWEAALAGALGVGLLLLARGHWRGALGAGLHGVARRSYGDLWFVAAVAALFILTKTAPTHGLGDVVYVLPVLILAVSDAAAALVGGRFGRLRFRIGDSEKSWEGVAAFVVTAWPIAFAVLALGTDLGLGEAALLGLLVATFGAGLEAVGGRGFDNLLVPLGVYVVLVAAVSDEPLGWSLELKLVALGLLIIALFESRRSDPAADPAAEARDKATARAAEAAP